MMMQHFMYPTTQLQTPSRTKVRKFRFNKTEDELLRRVVSQHPDLNWQVIASEIPGRTPRQCRERWLNHLSPCVNSAPLSVEEEQLLLSLLSRHGPKWVLISQHFVHRTDVFLKNWYKAMQKGRTASSYLPSSPNSPPPSISIFPNLSFEQSDESLLDNTNNVVHENDESNLDSFLDTLFDETFLGQTDYFSFGDSFDSCLSFEAF
jgi:hypothetical protein